MKYNGICLIETRKWSQGHFYTSLLKSSRGDWWCKINSKRCTITTCTVWHLRTSTKRGSDLTPFFFLCKERSTLRRNSSMSFNSLSDTHLNFSEETAWTFQNHLFVLWNGTWLWHLRTPQALHPTNGQSYLPAMRKIDFYFPKQLILTCLL